jgi:hypothetical protein
MYVFEFCISLKMPYKQLTMREKGNILIKLQENIKVGNNSISAIFSKCHVFL